MPLPAEIRPSHLGSESRAVTTQLFENFDEFSSISDLYGKVEQLFRETYNAPPWNEAWDSDLISSYLRILMTLPSQVTTVREVEEVIGFFIGCTGVPTDVVPLSVAAYFPNQEPEISEEMEKRIFSGLEESGVGDDPMFWGCDFAVPQSRRGATVAGKMLRQAIASPIEKGINNMYGMTMIGSPFHTITERRGSQTLLDVSEILPDNPRIFKVMDMRALQQ